MSYLDVINYFRLSDVDRGAKNQEQLNDLRDRATYLAQKTGQQPMSWYEFKQSHPVEPPKTLRNMLIGAATGILIGAGIGLLLSAGAAIFSLAFVGAFMGGAAGSFYDTENAHREAQVKQYDNYLNNFEISVAQGRGIAQQMGNVPGLKVTHAADLMADRQKPQTISVT